eukprot:1151130-Prymnesium_polylepis.1
MSHPADQPTNQWSESQVPPTLRSESQVPPTLRSESQVPPTLQMNAERARGYFASGGSPEVDEARVEQPHAILHHDAEVGEAEGDEGKDEEQEVHLSLIHI